MGETTGLIWDNLSILTWDNSDGFTGLQRTTLPVMVVASLCPGRNHECHQACVGQDVYWPQVIAAQVWWAACLVACWPDECHRGWLPGDGCCHCDCVADCCFVDGTLALGLCRHDHILCHSLDLLCHWSSLDLLCHWSSHQTVQYQACKVHVIKSRTSTKTYSSNRLV